LSLVLECNGGQRRPQSTTRPSSVTSESITKTVDKLQYELPSALRETLNDPATPLPTLANGHLGFTVFENAVYLAGLYNGAGGLSHRARIPNMASVLLPFPCTATLDLRSGLFRSDFVDAGASFRLTHLIYPHALYRRLIVNQFIIERIGTNAENISIPLMPAPAFTSEDIQFQPISTQASDHPSRAVPSLPNDDADLIYQSCGTTLQVENATYQNRGTTVCVLWNRVPERLELGERERNVTYRFLMAVDETEAIAQKELQTAQTLTDDALLESHTSLWRTFWNRSDILITGNEPLQRTVRASVYYLVSNLPFEASFTKQPGPFWGLSPTGLGRGGTNLEDYEGHSFWDTEIWMFPVLNLIDPWYSRLLIAYRAKMLPTARRLAVEAGYSGARFPWESAFTGVEVTQPCCPAITQYAHHITGDISFALRHYLATTHDRNWLRKEGGCEMAQLIAEFWSSRVRYNYTGTEYYDIPAVMGPDEDHENVTNNAYTNVVAGYALYFGEFVSCICGDDVTGKGWSKIARQIKLPYDEIFDFHPQYDGYLASTIIKQADAILLGYPLQYPELKPYTRWNDLRIYEPVTRSTGPAMSWSMHAVNHLDIVNHLEAAQNFNRSYQPYVRGPFHVWQEVQQPARGAQNFVTGAGGFLQAVLFGYAGLRVYLDRLEVKAHYSLELSTAGLGEVHVQGVQYLGALIVVKQRGDRAEMSVTHLDGEMTIEFGDGNTAVPVMCNRVLSVLLLAVLGVVVIAQSDTDERNYRFQTRPPLPDAAVMPTLANGNIGFVAYGEYVHLNGVYNGLGGKSHRARIPNYGNIQLTSCAPTSPGGVSSTCTYQLNMRTGKFVTVDETSEYRIVHEMYPHRYYDTVLVNRVRIQRLGTESTIQVRLSQIPGLQGGDINWQPSTEFVMSGQLYKSQCGVTVQVEEPTVQAFGHNVCVTYPTIPEMVQIEPDTMAKEFLLFTAFTMTAEDGRRQIEVVTGLIGAQEETLHMREMDRLWERYGISVERNEELDRVIKASAFYLFSSLPAHQVATSVGRYPFYGLAPAGLGRGGVEEQEYQGHSFWDTEIWMYPSILLVDPINAAKVLGYRTAVIGGARMNAMKNGYEGIQFPWESAFTGTEVTPDCCPEVVNFQHHITADIVFAARQYFYATGDTVWLKSQGCRLAADSSLFWLSRATYNNDTDLYDIRNAMGPDEDHPNVSNNAFTNVMAAHNLFFGEFASCFCRDQVVNETIRRELLQVARGLTLLYDEEGDFHPQFEGYEPNTPIKQADTVLLIYPLQYPMNVSTKANNLRKYSQVTRENGPAMTWAIHTIGHLELDEVEQAATMFDKSYRQYLRAPFNVWSENGNNEPGAGNFITGAGGFLQSLINGYAGVRLHQDRLEIKNARLPPDTWSLHIPTIEYRGVLLSLTVSANGFTIVVKATGQTDLKLTVNGKDESICKDCEYEGTTAIIQQTRDQIFDGCRLRPTTLGVRVADQTDSAPALRTTSLAFVSLVICFLLSKMF
uniref:Protein-glucosylgalactosylhydroxylysine glucosidase n=1 Tax=Anopheles christyi TaxID=43041 RepID=A0A182K1P1_9DIPT